MELKRNIIEESSYNSQGNLNDKKTFKYDAKNNLVEENKYYFDETLRYKLLFKYDFNGNRIEENKYSSNGRLRYKLTYQYQYDTHANWIRRIRYEDGKAKEISERKIEYYK